MVSFHVMSLIEDFFSFKARNFKFYNKLCEDICFKDETILVNDAFINTEIFKQNCFSGFGYCRLYRICYMFEFFLWLPTYTMWAVVWLLVFLWLGQLANRPGERTLQETYLCIRLFLYSVTQTYEKQLFFSVDNLWN